jgi:manganese/zinc/iron transport system permease protein
VSDWLQYLDNTQIVLLGVTFLGASAGLIGCFAVLRRRSLTGDALAHSALPGLCLGYLAVGERSLTAMLIGAFVSGLLGILVITALRRWTRIKEDAAIGIVLSVFFGAGIVLSSIIQRAPRGSIAGLDSFIFGKTAGMLREDVIVLAVLTLATAATVVLFYKEFKLVAFDPAFAQVQGWPAFALDLFLMLLIAVAVVVGLPVVGVLMMAALLIVPAAAARFWTNRLGLLLILSAGFGLAAGVAGVRISENIARLPTGPTIILSATALFLASLLLAPRRGVLARLLRQRRLRQELQAQGLTSAGPVSERPSDVCRWHGEAKP